MEHEHKKHAEGCCCEHECEHEKEHGCCCEHEREHEKEHGCCCGHEREQGCSCCGHEHGEENEKVQVIRLAVSAVLLAAAWLSPLAGIWRLLAFLVPYLIAGYTVLWQAAKNILHGEIFDEGFLMAIATIGAFFIGEYPEAVFVMIFFQVGELFEALPWAAAAGRSKRSWISARITPIWKKTAKRGR